MQQCSVSKKLPLIDKVIIWFYLQFCRYMVLGRLTYASF